MYVSKGRCYLGERILKMRIGLIWLLLLICVFNTAADPLVHLPLLAIVTSLFIITFRLWDDLEDLDYDRKNHPQRYLTRLTNTQHFHTAVWFLLACITGLLFFLAGNDRALAFLVFVMVFFIMYRATAKQPALRSLRVTLVLAKYPTFVLLLAQNPNDITTLLVAFCSYLVPLLDELRSTGTSILLPAAAFIGLTILIQLTLIT